MLYDRLLQNIFQAYFTWFTWFFLFFPSYDLACLDFNGSLEIPRKTAPHCARVINLNEECHGGYGWCPRVGDSDPWLQVKEEKGLRGDRQTERRRERNTHAHSNNKRYRQRPTNRRTETTVESELKCNFSQSSSSY